MSAASQSVVFLRALQALTNRIHATQKLDEILVELSPEICRLFGAQRLTIYVASEDGRELIAKVQAGRLSQTDLRQRLKQKLDSLNAQPWQTRQSTPPLFTHFLLKTIYGQTAR